MSIFADAFLADASCVKFLCGRQMLFGAMAGLRLGRFIPSDGSVRGVLFIPNTFYSTSFYLNLLFMKTKFTILPHPYDSTSAVNISIAGIKWTQLLQSISKNINAYLYNKTIPDNYRRVVPTPCRSAHECSQQGIKRPDLLFSRMNYKSIGFLTTLQESKKDSYSIGSVFRNESFFNIPIHFRYRELTSQYLMEIQVPSWHLLFRKKPKNPI